MVEIQLTQGQVASIDDVDADLAALGWHAVKRFKTFYAQRNVLKPDGKWTTEALHQPIARRKGIVGPPDHIDRDGLNNRRDNLRPATKTQNQANKGLQANNTSGFKGVSWHAAAGKWFARIGIDGKRRPLGFFDDPIEAAKAYGRAALAAWGEYALLNFPPNADERTGVQ